MKKITELALYRIIQEVCNNIIKHANATQIEVNITRNSQQLVISIVDNGDGFLYGSMRRGKGKHHGLGLKNIESRLSMINANITYSLAEVKGTKACIKMGYK